MRHIKTSTVRDFLRAILPTEAHFPPKSWIFRGQADSRWGLVPSLRRERAWDRLGGAQRFGLEAAKGIITSSEENLCAAEQQVLTVLRYVIDRTGLDQTLKQDDNVVAFAQHIGLPTRLLDWTRAPFIAAYFAASDAVTKPPDPEGYLSVYAMSSLYLIKYPYEVAKVEHLVVPGAGNPNMVAQQGVFTRMNSGTDLLERVDRIDWPAGKPLGRLDAVLLDHHLVVVTLPWTSAPELLRVLRDQGIHGASVYPNQYGTAALVREVFFEPDVDPKPH